VSDNAYVKLIARYINDAKTQVENAYNWNCLSNTLTATTQPSIFSYALTDSGQRFRVIDVLNDTTNTYVRNISTTEMNKLFLMAAGVASGPPVYYNFNGTDNNGDTLIDFYPAPDTVYQIRVNIIQPQPDLVANADQMLVPREAVILAALARAQAERGEDGGVQSAETYALFKQSLADAIALESGRYIEDSEWVAI
jgi:predicted nucleic acid-binding Zn ribbon protein